MTQRRTMNRREFTLASAMAALSGVAITITGCSDSPTAPTAIDVTGEVANNHGHTASVTSGQITAGNTLSLNIQGSSPHAHTVELTAADLSQIRNRQRVSKDSTTTASHSHTVTFN